MNSVTIEGGHICSTNNTDNYAGVDIAIATQTSDNTATWVVTLTGVPRQQNFTVNENLTYNSKGTNNHNADNSLTVTQVNGPTKYTCTGNWPVNT